MSGCSAAIACERGLRLLGLAAHDEIGLPVDQQRQPLADDRMIVHDEDPVFRRGAAAAVRMIGRHSTLRALCSGNRQLTTVPPRSPRRTSSVPPIMLAR